MEEGGAKSQEITARRKEVEREMRDREERAQREAELIEDAFDTFRSMKSKQLVESEQLWREIADRYSSYYEGGMGAEAIKDLLGRLDLGARWSGSDRTCCPARRRSVSGPRSGSRWSSRSTRGRTSRGT